jgi:adenylate kinase
MKTLRQRVFELACEIDGEVQYGECFYEEDMLNNFCNSLDKMKELAREYYKEIQSEMDKE